MQWRMFTCYLGADAGGDGRAEALVRGGFEGEEVGGPRVETYEQVMGLVPQLENPSPLCCQISAGVQWAQGLVGDLEADRRHSVLHISSCSLQQLINVLLCCLDLMLACNWLYL